MKKKVSIIILSIIVLSLVGGSIAGLKGVFRLEFLNQKASQGETQNIKERSKLEENSEVEEVELREQLLRVDMQGDVAVGVIFLNPQEEDQDYLNFEVILDTHSVNLDEYNLGEITTLFIDDKIKITEGIKWQVESGSGHHILGSIQVPRNNKGKIINYLEADFTELEIKEIGEIASRKFRWEKDELVLSK